MEVMRELQFKLLPAGHTLVPQLIQEEVWPTETLTQSSITLPLASTDQPTQVPKGKLRPREVQDLPEVTQAAVGRAAVTISACRWQQVGSVNMPLQRRGKRDLPQLWLEFRLGVGRNFLTSGGSSQKGLEKILIWRKGFLSFFSYVPVGGPCPSLSLPFYSDITPAPTVCQVCSRSIICQVCSVKSHDPQRPCFGTGVYSA